MHLKTSQKPIKAGSDQILKPKLIPKKQLLTEYQPVFRAFEGLSYELNKIVCSTTQNLQLVAAMQNENNFFPFWKPDTKDSMQKKISWISNHDISYLNLKIISSILILHEEKNSIMKQGNVKRHNSRTCKIEK